MRTSEITTAWAPTRTKETVEKSVKLTDAPDISWQRKAKHGPGHGRPYSIRFEFVRYDGGPWLGSVRIYAQRPESIVGDFFSPDKVIDPPQWLTDLIEQAHPAHFAEHGASIPEAERPDPNQAGEAQLNDHPFGDKAGKS